MVFMVVVFVACKGGTQMAESKFQLSCWSWVQSITSSCETSIFGCCSARRSDTACSSSLGEDSYSFASAMPRTIMCSLNRSKGASWVCDGGGIDVEKLYRREPFGKARGEKRLFAVLASGLMSPSRTLSCWSSRRRNVLKRCLLMRPAGRTKTRTRAGAMGESWSFVMSSWHWISACLYRKPLL
jgi:hypothetical protein